MSDGVAVAIVGVAESDEIGHVDGKSSLQHGMEAAVNALADAGIDKGDVDGLFTARHSPLAVAEYVGLEPRYFDGTWIGGASFESHLLHAMGAIKAGRCHVALIVHGQAGRSARRPPLSDEDGIAHGNVVDSPDPNQPHLDFELPFGIAGAPAQYALACSRYMHEHGEERTRAGMYEVARAARCWASLNPRALRRDPLTAEDYERSPWIVWPLRRLDCCLVTDAGGAVVVVGGERAQDGRKPAVWVLGGAERSTHSIISQMPDLTRSAAFLTGPAAFDAANVGPSDIDLAMLYDAFTFTTLMTLEDLGFCEKGEAPDFVADGALAPNGALPTNTNGGGLSYTHTGMHGIFLLVEAVQQLRGECGVRQVSKCDTALVNGLGGVLSSAATLVMSRHQ